MKKNWALLSAVTVFLFTITGLGYVSYRNSNPNYNNGTSILGKTTTHIDVSLNIEFDGKKINYDTSELKPNSTLRDLIDLYNGEYKSHIQLKTDLNKDFIDRVEGVRSDEEHSWTVYIDNLEYVGFFDEVVLLDNSSVRIIFE